MYRISNFAQKYQQLKDIDVRSVAMTLQFVFIADEDSFNFCFIEIRYC